MLRILGWMVVMAASTLCVFGQAPGSLPMSAEVTAITADRDGRPVVSVLLKNTSPFSVIAYVLNIAVVDKSGNRTVNVDKVFIRGMGDSKQAEYYAPGASWNEVLELPIIPAPGVQQTYKVSVDYVRTTNPRHPDAGPDRSRKSQLILGAISAYKAERSRLRWMALERGFQSVMEDLKTAP